MATLLIYCTDLNPTPAQPQQQTCTLWAVHRVKRPLLNRSTCKMSNLQQYKIDQSLIILIQWYKTKVARAVSHQYVTPSYFHPDISNVFL